MTSAHDSGREQIRHEVALHCVDQHERPLTFMSTFAYDASTPYAVAIICHLTEADLTWTIDRAVVEAGLVQPAGFGSVRLRPVADDVGSRMVEIQFDSSTGRLVTDASAADVRQFLADTWTAVPPGTESDHLDLDGLVEDLLES